MRSRAGHPLYPPPGPPGRPAPAHPLVPPLDEQVSRSLNTERMLAALSGSFGALALPCVAALGKLVQSQSFGVTANDPATVAGAALVLAAARSSRHSSPPGGPQT